MKKLFILTSIIFFSIHKIVFSQAPVVSAIIPDSGQVSSTIQINGSNFDNTSTVAFHSDYSNIRTITGHTSAINSVTYSADGSLIASASQDFTLKIWNATDGSLIRTLSHPSWVFTVAFSPDGTLLASGGADSTVRIWRVSDGQLMATLIGHTNHINSVSFSPDGLILASGSVDYTVKLWQVSNGNLLRTINSYGNIVDCVKFTPDGSKLAVGGGFLKYYNVSDGSLIREFFGHTDRIYSLVFTPDGNKIIGGSGDNTIRVWEINGSLIRTLTGHTNSIFCVDLSPEGELLASGSWDNTIKLWNINTGELIISLPGHVTYLVRSLEFNKDGTELVSGSYDYTLKQWRIRAPAEFTINSSTSITTTLPSNSETGKILVQNLDGTTESTQIFKVLPPTLINVPADYPTIQAAIDASANGDTILVAPGDYFENINFNSKDILVTSNALYDRDTLIVNQTKIISQNNIEPVAIISGNSQLIGFSIQGGNNGVVPETGSSSKVDFCKIYGGLGWGIKVEIASIEILSCKIYSNLGGGIYLYSYSGSIKNTESFNNSGPGINLYGAQGELLIQNCLLYNNTIGINNRSQNPVTLTNTTIYGNNSGIICVEGSAFTINNSILYNTGTPITLTFHTGVHILNLDFSIIEGGQNGIDNQNQTAVINYGENNIDFDPLFSDDNNYDFHLSEFSPGIGSGTLSVAPLIDIEGNPRPNPAGSDPDIGAYESPLEHFNLLPPDLYSVLNGSINQSINIQLDWYPVYAATSYGFQLSTDSTFQTVLIDQQNITDTLFEVSALNYLTTYYWRVNASYPYDTSDWSEKWHFTTIIENPVVPNLILPTNNSINLPINLNFEWHASARAEKYEFQAATDSLFQNIIFQDTSLIDTSVSISGLSFNNKYFWRVRAKNLGGYSNFSTTWNFRTKLQTPTLQSPANNSQNISINPTLTWSEVAGTPNYHLQVALDPGFNQIEINDSSIVNPSVQIGPLVHNSTYYWKVKAYSGNFISDFSIAFNFTTIIENPNFPVLLSPVNGAVNQPLNTTFTWEPVLSAISYRLQISTDSLFGTFVFNDSTISTTSKLVNLPNSNQKYFWRVQAKNVAGYGPFSDVWYLISILPAPALTSITPANKQIQITWNQIPVANLLQHNIYRDVTPNPTQLVSNVPANQSSYTDLGLVNGVTYFYRVTSVSTYGIESEHSNQLSATPFNSPPVAVALNNVFLPNEGRDLTKQLSFSSSGSSDPDGTIDTIKWFVNNEFITNSEDLSFEFPQGTFEVSLVVIDNDNQSDTSRANVTRSMFRKYVNGQVTAGLSLIGTDILYAVVSGDAIYRMDKDGDVDYTLQVGGNVLSSSSIANDSSVYIGSTDNNIYAFSKNGTSQWVRPLGGSVTVTPTIDLINDRIYVGASNRNFQFLNRSTGTVLGNFFSDAAINTSAVITFDNKLFFSTINGTMYGFDLTNLTFPNVDPDWIIQNSDTITTSPAIDEEGFFYVGTQNGLLLKISMQNGLQGTIVWQANLGGSITASPIIDANGNLYVGSSNTKFFSLDKSNGNIKWSNNFGGPIRTSATISDQSRIYLGTDNGYIYCLDTMGTQIWEYNDSTAICSALLYSEGALYFGTLGGRLVAIFDSTTSVNYNILSSDHIWATFQGNKQRTGEQTDRVTGIKEDASSLPKEFALYNNFPNPYNPNTIIRYAIPYVSQVKIEIFTIIGERVRTLVETEQTPGYYNLNFDAAGLASGIYIYRIYAISKDQQNHYTNSKKMILMK